MGTDVFRAVLGICLLAGSLVLSDRAKAAEGSMTVDDPAIYLLFLHYHAQDASRRIAGTTGPNSVSRAAQLHINPVELSLIDQKALAYATEDKKIHEQALKYREACISAHKPLDLIVIHSFTMRRLAHATAAFADIHSGLSATSYAGLEQYLNVVFMKSFKRQQVGQ
jgi:hypothetical protein